VRRSWQSELEVAQRLRLQVELVELLALTQLRAVQRGASGPPVVSPSTAHGSLAARSRRTSRSGEPSALHAPPAASLRGVSSSSSSGVAKQAA
jgi:hypothetical protein